VKAEGLQSTVTIAEFTVIKARMGYLHRVIPNFHMLNTWPIKWWVWRKCSSKHTASWYIFRFCCT